MFILIYPKTLAKLMNRSEIYAKGLKRHKKLKEVFITIAHLSRKLGIHVKSIHKWKRLNSIPLKRALRICELSEGKISLEELIDEELIDMEDIPKT